MALQRTHKSTNVRFILLLVASALCSACVSSASLQSSAQACEPGRLAVCAQFGPQQQCRCEQRHEIDTLLATFGNPAWLGGRH